MFLRLGRVGSRLGKRAAAAWAAPATGWACKRALSNMPLRAKLASPPPILGTQKAEMSTLLEEIREFPDDPKEDVLFNSIFGLRSIELNNQPKLNSLDGSMIRKIAPRLREWSRSDMANVIVIKGAGEKAMCAGGDVKTLAKQNLQGPEGVMESVRYFAHEYCLDHYIATYNKPVVAFMDGITMGGGVGLSAHAPFRIATERTVFAMPETNIGFFPDVGGTFFLPRMEGELGTYLALTSDRVQGPNVYWTGIATHYLHSAQLPALEQRLAELRFHDYTPYEKRLELVNQTIEEFDTGMPWDQQLVWGGETRKIIDRCFAHDRVQDILRALEECEEKPEWGKKVAGIIRQRSPTSVAVTLRQLRVGNQWPIAEVFMREYQLAARFMAHPDFSEGVMALLGKDKRKPQWKPASLDEIEDEQDYVTKFYTGGKDVDDLELWSKANYQEYPYHFGVPTEWDIFKLIQEYVAAGPDQPPTVDAIMLAAHRKWHRKQGIKPVVLDILHRRAEIASQDGRIVAWNKNEKESERVRREEEKQKEIEKLKSVAEAERKAATESNWRADSATPRQPHEDMARPGGDQ